MTRELTTDLEVLERLVPLAGRDVLDVGCGHGMFARELAARGARAVGMEISEAQLGDARDRGGLAPVQYVIGRGEALPLDDASMDVVAFMRSLHHVPRDAMAGALREAGRVLRPGGVVYIAEPVAEGDYWELVQIVDDETDVRAAAQAAIDAAPGIAERRTHEYEVGTLTTMARLRSRIVDVNPARAEVFEAHRPELQDAFARLGEPREGGRWFTQPMRADLLVPA